MSDTKEIRAELKATLGYNARMVSVKQNHSAIRFTIRNAEIKKEEIESFGLRYQSVDRDQATGEILCGGNTFVFVDYSDVVKDELINSVVKEVEKAIEKIEDDEIIEVKGTIFSVGFEKYNKMITIWKNDQSWSFAKCHGVRFASLTIAAA